MLIQRTIKEQGEILSASFEPLEFFLKYIDLFQKQLGCSTKVFLFQIPYYKVFVVDFWKFIQVKARQESARTALSGIDEALADFGSRQYYDAEFFDFCAKTLFCGYDRVVERTINEIQEFKYDNLDSLIRYSGECIDVSAHLLSKAAANINDVPRLVDEVVGMAQKVEEINEGIKDSRPSALVGVLKSKTGENGQVALGCLPKVPRSMTGECTNKKYDIRKLCNQLILSYVESVKSKDSNDKYLAIMDLSGEFAKHDGFEPEVLELKSIAKACII